MRTKRSVLGVATGVGFTLVTFLTSIFATPILLRWLGAERLGAFRALTDWYGYMTLLELGLSGALLPLLARALGRRDETELNYVIGAGLRAYLWIALLMVISGVVLTLAIPVLVPVNPALRDDLTTGCIINTIGLALIPLTTFRLLSEARQRAYFVNILMTAQALTITFLSLLMGIMGAGITGQCVAVVIGNAMFYVAISTKELLRFVRFHQRSPTQSAAAKTIRRELWRLNRPTFLLSVCGRAGLFTDNIIVAGLLSPKAVIPFFLSQRLAAVALLVLQHIGTSSWAALAEFYVRGETERFNEWIIKLTKVLTICSLSLLIPIAAYSKPFIAAWIGAENYAGDSLVVVACFNAFAQAITTWWLWAFGGTGKAALLTRFAVGGTILNVVASIVLTKCFGWIGPVAGTLLMFLTVHSWYVPHLLRRTFHTEISKLYRAIWLPLIWSVPAGWGVWLFPRVYAPRHIFDVLGEMALASALYLMLAWLVILTKSEREEWFLRAQFILRRNPVEV
jgi:O-antigen/teichoic acid export membrane protein